MSDDRSISSAVQKAAWCFLYSSQMAGCRIGKSVYLSADSAVKIVGTAEFFTSVDTSERVSVTSEADSSEHGTG